MREILFRAKCKNTGEWIEGIPYKMYGNVYFPNKGDSNLFFAEVYPETVGQFTGLTDKNDVKIFEGDIVKFREWREGSMCWIGKVHYEKQQFVVSGNPNKECGTSFVLCMSRFISKDIEVTGNIYDNSVC